MLKRLEKKIILYHLKEIRDEYGQPRLVYDEKIETRGSIYQTNQFTSNNPDFLDIDAVLTMRRRDLDANWMVELSEDERYRITYNIPSPLCKRFTQYLLKDTNEIPLPYIVHNIYYKIEDYDTSKQLRLRDTPSEGYSLDANLPNTDPAWANELANIRRVIIEEDIYPKSCYRWFAGAEHLAYVINSDKINLSKCTSLYQMFSGCAILSTSIKFGSGAPLNETCEGFFEGVNGVIDIDVSGLCTENCTSLKGMFNDASGMRVINGLGTFDTKNVTDMSDLFDNCIYLYNIDGVENWSTAKVIDFSRAFKNTKHLPFIDLNNWQITSATSLEEMFWITGSRSINIKRFTPSSSLMSCKNMFRNSQWCMCIGCDDHIFAVPEGCDTRYMFNGCYALPDGDNTWAGKTTQNPGSAPVPYFNTYADSRVIFSINMPANLNNNPVYSFEPEYIVQANQPTWNAIYGTGVQNFVLDYSLYSILLNNKLKPVRAYVALKEHLVSYCDQIIDIDGITQIVITDSEYNSSTHYLSITDNIALTDGEWYVVYDSRGECICNYSVNPQFIYLYGSFEPGQSYLLSVRKYKIGKMYSEQQIGIIG